MHAPTVVVRGVHLAENLRIGMIGDGNVGTALTQGLTRAGHTVEAVGKEPDRVRRVAEQAQVVFLAVPFGERENALREMGDAVDGKVLVDVTNAIGDDMSLATDPRRESGAEQVQRLAPRAKVVKAFNTVFAQHMDKGAVHGEQLTVLAAGDDVAAKRRVVQLAKEIGFDAVDAGPLETARLLETLGLLNITLAYKNGFGPMMGFRMLHEATGSRPTPKGAEQRR